jgi:hypothetical protein
MVIANKNVLKQVRKLAIKDELLIMRAVFPRCVGDASVILDLRANTQSGVMVMDKKVGVGVTFAFPRKPLPEASPEGWPFVRESANEANDRGHDNNHRDQFPHGPAPKLDELQHT